MRTQEAAQRKIRYGQSIYDEDMQILMPNDQHTPTQLGNLCW